LLYCHRHRLVKEIPNALAAAVETKNVIRKKTKNIRKGFKNKSDGSTKWYITPSSSEG
jgi:hypothetical protein